MHLNGSGATEAWFAGYKVWPVTPPITGYTFVNRVYADLGTAGGNNKDLQLGTPLNFSTFTLRLKATTRQNTSGSWVGRSPTRFFGTYGTVYWDIAGDSGANRMSVNAANYGFASGDTFDVVLKNHSLYNLSNNSGATGTTVVATGSTANIRVRLSHLYVYEIEVMDGDTVTGFYKPAMRDSDGVYGLYDTITNTFYTSPDFTIYGDNGGS